MQDNKGRKQRKKVTGFYTEVNPKKGKRAEQTSIRNILTYATPCRDVDFCTFTPFGSSMTVLRSLLVLEKFTQCVNFARKLLELK